MLSTTKKICVTAMGCALFVVLALCVRAPVFENYYLCLGYVVMAVFCYFFGPLSGMVVGSLGVVLYCLLTDGLRGMPGWAVGNLVIGLLVGLTCKATKNMHSRLLRQFLIATAVLLSTAIAMLGVKSLIECLLYAQPLLLRAAKNLYAFVADAVVLLISFPICLSLAPVVHKLFPKLSTTPSSRK